MSFTCDDCNYEHDGMRYDAGKFKDGGKCIVCRECMIQRLRDSGYKSNRKLAQFELGKEEKKGFLDMVDDEIKSVQEKEKNDCSGRELMSHYIAGKYKYQFATRMLEELRKRMQFLAEDRIYKFEEEHLKLNFRYSNAIIVMRGVATISKELYDLACFNLFEVQDDAHKSESREQIDKMKRSGTLRQCPAIALGDRGEIADGNHRIVAMYEQGIKTHPAILVRRD